MKNVLLTATLLLSTTSYINAATVASGSGQEFNVIAVPGDGDCAFTAIGKSRFEVVTALKDAVEDNLQRMVALRRREVRYIMLWQR